MNFLLVLIVAIAIHLGSVCGQAGVGENLFVDATSTENGFNNDNLQARLSAYYQAMQALPYQNAGTNLQNHQGYNYITPASTYTGYSTATHKTQTAPLAVSLHPDDYTKFDKTDQTFFLPKTKSPAAKALWRQQPSFYISRSQAKQSQIRGPDIAGQNRSPEGDSEQSQYESGLKPTLVETQQRWKPLPRQPSPVETLIKSSQKSSFGINTALTSADTSNTLNQYSQESINTYRGRPTEPQPTTFNPETTADCQRHLTKLQDQEISLGSFPSLEGQNLNRVPVSQREEVPSLSSSSNPASPIQAPRSFPTASSVNALNQRRLNIIKSLLAEYIALTQTHNVPSGNPSTQPYVKNDDTTVGVGDNGYSADPQLTQLPANLAARLASPAANKFSDGDQTERQQFYQTQAIVPAAVRQPHAVYGTPFVDSFNPASN